MKQSASAGILPLLVLLTCAAWFVPAQSAAVTINVVEKVVQLDGTSTLEPIAGGFRWLAEEDNTNLTVPNAKVADSISLDIHKSHAPVVAKGVDGEEFLPATPGRYFISVLPNSGYANGGAAVSSDQTKVDVIVTPLPQPTALISILVFEDHFPINNAPDLPNERGLAGFTVQLFDAGGMMSQDAFGNPLGTEYDEFGNAVPGTGGELITDGTGEIIVRYLAPGKYGVKISPPTIDEFGNPVTWIQTATIEGTKTVDAWVKADESPLFVEGFGTGFYHAFFGFVNPAALPWSEENGGPVVPPGESGHTVSGRNVFNHFSRPPTLQGNFAGPPVGECWVALNDPVTAMGMVAKPCNDDSTFAFEGIPAGNYQLATWDAPLDALFGLNTITVPDGDIDLGNVLSFRWFGTLKGKVFIDTDEDGFPDAGETTGISNQAVNLRFRDGTLYQAQATDIYGEYEFAEVFPFFKWLVAEVDFAGYKATGMTAASDYGGEIPPGFSESAPWVMPTFDALNPQPQVEVNPNTGNNLSRTEQGEVLTQGLMLFLNQTNVIDWGKKPYTLNENGGISGLVIYDITRDVNDPAFAAAQDWEPGIPRAQVNLYFDTDHDQVIDDFNGNGVLDYADVDNYPFGDFPGVGDIDRNGNGRNDWGDAINVVYTDSWDDSPPSGCVQDLPVVHGITAKECFDNFATWNQVRPAVFDGGYAITSYFPNGQDGPELSPLPATDYIVEAATPTNYVLVKEEDKNVDFGIDYTPGTQALPPACVGDDHLVPNTYSLFDLIDDLDNSVPPLYAGQTRKLCDRKAVSVYSRQNTAAEFFFYTEVPKAARAVGFVNNDLAAEFDPTSPIFGEKAAAAWIPIAWRNYEGTEIARVYADEYGGYNALLPGSYTVNVPTPSGVAPNMLTLVLNDPGPIPDPNNPGLTILDPDWRPEFAVVPWTLHYESGKTTYLDTPIVPLAGFVVNPGGVVLDAGYPDGTPVIGSVIGNKDSAQVCADGDSITINAATSATADYGFGSVPGSVTLNGVALTITSWSATQIVATLPTLASYSTGQLVVTRGDNALASEVGLTLVVGGCDAGTLYVVGNVFTQPGEYQTIQEAIDAAAGGETILVKPGTYNENVILYKSVRLQGSGAANTIINANPNPTERLNAWHQKVIDILGGDVNPMEAPGVIVLGNTQGPGGTGIVTLTDASIDGFTIIGAASGGGIYLNTDTDGVVISNNIITGNQGIYGGGITSGIPEGADANNVNLVIRNNQISKNGGIQGGGGVNIYQGSPDYLVENNLISGNFTRFTGAGINHVGLSDGGRILNNKIVFNEVFYGLPAGNLGDGGGIFVGGDIINSVGAGDVLIDGNLIQGNLSGAGSGGGIRSFAFNVAGEPDYLLTLTNNIIANNVAGYRGAGIALNDTIDPVIVHNTIANNDVTSTAQLAFGAGNLYSTPQPSGLVVEAYGPALAAAETADAPTPALVNNIVWQNRTFFNDPTLNAGAGGLRPGSEFATATADPTVAYPDVWDLQVVGAANTLAPTSSILSELTRALDAAGGVVTGPEWDYSGDPSNFVPTAEQQQVMFLLEYQNTLFVSSVLDEGGNAISVRFTPLSMSAGDYHLTCVSPALETGTDVFLTYPSTVFDIDGETRPGKAVSDIGADEYHVLYSPEIIFYQPNANTWAPSGRTQEVCWAGPSGSATFDLDYRIGNKWRTVEDGFSSADFSYSWEVPLLNKNSKKPNVQLQLTAYDGGGNLITTGTSDLFSISVLRQLAPNGGEVVSSGSDFVFSWDANIPKKSLLPKVRPVGEVRISYKHKGSKGWQVLASLTDPADIAPGIHTKVLPMPTTTTNLTDVQWRVELIDSVKGKRLAFDNSDARMTIQTVAP